MAGALLQSVVQKQVAHSAGRWFYTIF